jgi:type IV pilus assembly protein PilF
MTKNERVPAVGLVRWLGIFFCIVGLAGWGGLSGCTTTHSSHSSMGNASSSHSATEVPSDLLTESDEPDARKRARLRLQLAVAYFDKGQSSDALDQIKQSIAADPTLSEAYNLRGLVYMRLNKLELAEDSFRRALAYTSSPASVLHNLGWLLCQQQSRLGEAIQFFAEALASPSYAEKSKTWMTQGLCQQRYGNAVEAENSFMKSYELDPNNPVSAYNLALLLFQNDNFVKSQFYIRRLNNGSYANAESLWLGIKVERQLNNTSAMMQLAAQLKKRFPDSREYAAFEKRLFNE